MRPWVQTILPTLSPPSKSCWAFKRCDFYSPHSLTFVTKRVLSFFSLRLFEDFLTKLILSLEKWDWGSINSLTHDICGDVGDFLTTNESWYFLVVQGFEVRAINLWRRWSTTWATLQPCSMLGVSKIGSWELFAWTGFELQSSWSQPLK
jgi:hypothetical protein